MITCFFIQLQMIIDAAPLHRGINQTTASLKIVTYDAGDDTKSNNSPMNNKRVLMYEGEDNFENVRCPFAPSLLRNASTSACSYMCWAGLCCTSVLLLCCSPACVVCLPVCVCVCVPVPVKIPSRRSGRNTSMSTMVELASASIHPQQNLPQQSAAHQSPSFPFPQLSTSICEEHAVTLPEVEP